MDLGSARTSGDSVWGHSREPLRRSSSSGGGGGGDAGSCRLPPLPRPPSAEDIDAARQHLTLLKARMPHRFRGRRDRSAGPPRRSSSPSAADVPRGRSMPPRPTADIAREHARNDAMDDVTGAPRRMSPKVRSSSPSRRHASDTHRGDRRPPADLNAVVASPGHGRRQPGDFQERMPSHRDDRARDDRGDRPQEHASPASAGAKPTRPPVAQPSSNTAVPVPPMPDGYTFNDDAFGDGAAETVELVPCSGCGRKFKQEALERHSKICKKVFCEKRKAFDSAANRLGELEGADRLIQNAKKIETEKEVQKRTSPTAAAAPAAKSDKPIPAWKKKSLEFRAAMLASKAETGDAEALKKEQEVKAELTAMGGNEPANDPTKAQCPHCGRTFNKDSAQRHIDICLKMFGGKKGGGGRLVRGGGKNAYSVAAAAANTAAAAPQVPTAARNDKNAGGRRMSHRAASNDAPTGRGANAPPPLPGGRSDQPPSRERPLPRR